MAKSFCIKTNNSAIIDYLLKNLACIDLEEIYFVNKSFKIYKNVIVHYKGNEIYDFISILSTILTDCILLFYEPILIKRSINYNYFYFDNFEKKIIYDNCYSYINSGEDGTLKFRKDEIYTVVLEYINKNKAMILDGFVNFRLDEYLSTIDETVDFSVNKYVIEKEYNEFIDLLKFYIDSKESKTNLVHLIYANNESILLDESKNIISYNDNIFDYKYLSDISFSSNDYALNALLTLLPKKIEAHIIGYEDEFIGTLKSIFTSRVSICKNCNICKTYRVLNNINTN